VGASWRELVKASKVPVLGSRERHGAEHWKRLQGTQRITALQTRISLWSAMVEQLGADHGEENWVLRCCRTSPLGRDF